MQIPDIEVLQNSAFHDQMPFLLLWTASILVSHDLYNLIHVSLLTSIKQVPHLCPPSFALDLALGETQVCSTTAHTETY